MRKIYATFLLLCGFFSGFSQKADSNFYIIKMVDEKDSQVVSEVYIDEVFDGRQYKENIGTIVKGAFDQKVFVNFETSLEHDLNAYFDKVYPKDESKRPISVRISELNVSEITTSQDEPGYASIVMDVIENIDGMPYLIGRYYASQKRDGRIKARKQDDRIKESLKNCIDQYLAADPALKLKVPFEAKPEICSSLSSEIKKGVYWNYSDFINNKPHDSTDYAVTSSNKKFFLRHKKSGLPMNDFYAFSDGTDVFYNLSKYSLDRHYAKVDIVKSKIITDEVTFTEHSSVMWGAMFGILGVLIADATSESTSKIPMVIDGVTGIPIFLTDSTVRNLLKPYPDLFKSYKNGRRTSFEKKHWIKKMYERS